MLVASFSISYVECALELTSKQSFYTGAIALVIGLSANFMISLQEMFSSGGEWDVCLVNHSLY